MNVIVARCTTWRVGSGEGSKPKIYAPIEGLVLAKILFINAMCQNLATGCGPEDGPQSYTAQNYVLVQIR
jgi:hypothetical protein